MYDGAFGVASAAAAVDGPFFFSLRLAGRAFIQGNRRVYVVRPRHVLQCSR